jgi:hypothetical protein
MLRLATYKRKKTKKRAAQKKNKKRAMQKTLKERDRKSQKKEKARRVLLTKTKVTKSGYGWAHRENERVGHIGSPVSAFLFFSWICKVKEKKRKKKKKEKRKTNVDGGSVSRRAECA